ncbi:MAG: hypothetical protein GF329_00055 [Candidatus Lokiarchaeota archaeon]|nr:hypothetical protein [Candidatus Lokiarchaeota archaeon]
MRGSERVRRAIHFRNPDKIPIYDLAFADVFPMISMPSRKWQTSEKNVYPHLQDDFIRLLRIYKWRKPEWAMQKWWKKKREEVDDWGCYWMRSDTDRITMGHPGRPVLDTWDKLDEWEGPDVEDKNCYKLFGRLSKVFGLRKYKLANVHGSDFIYSRVSMLRGFNNTLIDHMKNQKEMHRLIRKVTNIFKKNIRMWMNYKPHGVFVCDDLGMQTGLFFKPEIFKKFYAEPYKEITKLVHDYGCDFILHSCGNVAELIPTFIDLGIDCLEFDSPRQSGFDKLIKYKGRIAFMACVDIQTVYPKGTPLEIAKEVKRMIRTFSTKKGGYLAYFYTDPKAINVPKRNIKAYKQALKKWRTYPIEILEN